MLICSMPGCQTGAGCVCSRLRGPDTWGQEVYPMTEPYPTENAKEAALQTARLLLAYAAPEIADMKRRLAYLEHLLAMKEKAPVA